MTSFLSTVLRFLAVAASDDVAVECIMRKVIGKILIAKTRIIMSFELMLFLLTFLASDYGL